MALGYGDARCNADADIVAVAPSFFLFRMRKEAGCALRILHIFVANSHRTMKGKQGGGRDCVYAFDENKSERCTCFGKWDGVIFVYEMTSRACA